MLKLATLLSVLIFAFPVFAADICRLPGFGDATADVVKQYGLEDTFKKDAPLTRLVGRARKLCSGLPADAEVIYTFMYGTFTGLRIEHRGETQPLKELGEKQFGTIAKTPLQDAARNFQYAWPSQNGKAVVYSFAPEGEHMLEVLDVASTQHRILGNRASEADEALDEEAP